MDVSSVLPYKFEPIKDKDAENTHHRLPFFDPERIRRYVSSTTMCLVCTWCGMCFTINEWAEEADKIGGRTHVKEMKCMNISCQKPCKWHLTTFEGLEDDMQILKKEKTEKMIEQAIDNPNSMKKSDNSSILLPEGVR